MEHNDIQDCDKTFVSKNEVNTNPRKGFGEMPYDNNLTGILTMSDKWKKTITVKYALDKPAFKIVEIRKYYLKGNRGGDEAIYLIESEYNFMVNALLYGKRSKQIFENKNQTRSLSILPNPSIGGVNVQQIANGKYRFVRLTGGEVDKILKNYGNIHYFTKDDEEVYLDVDEPPYIDETKEDSVEFPLKAPNEMTLNSCLCLNHKL